MWHVIAHLSFKLLVSSILFWSGWAVGTSSKLSSCNMGEARHCLEAILSHAIQKSHLSEFQINSLTYTPSNPSPNSLVLTVSSVPPEGL